MSFVYLPTSAVPPLIPGDENVTNIIANGNSEFFGTLTIVPGVIYPTTITTPGQLIVDNVITGNISTGTLTVVGPLYVTSQATFNTISVTTLVVSGALTVTSQATFNSISVGTLSATGAVGFYDSAPTIQPTTSITPGAYASVGGSAVSSNDTFGGYSIGQIVAALKAEELLD